MADGSVKSIDKVKVGDKVLNAVPGQSKNQVHTVSAVLVTTSDRDFVDVGVRPVVASGTAKTETISKSGLVGKAVAGVAAAVALAVSPQVADAAPAPASTLTTTFHHPFYDVTQSAFVDAKDLKPGDVLQSETGSAVVASVRLYHASQVTWDLTIGDLHTYFVVAGATPILVHNDSCPISLGAKGRLDSRRQAIKDNAPKRQRPGTISEMESVTDSGLSAITEGASGRTSNSTAEPVLKDLLESTGHPHGGCSEIDCINSALQSGIDPRGSTITTMGILSKRIGTSLDGEIMAPCAGCQRVLDSLDIRSTGNG
jgi:hypothetical protein